MNEKLTCPECKSPDLVKMGVVWSGRTKVQQYKCNTCGRLTVHPLKVKGAELVPRPV